MIKRMFDIIVSIIALIIFSPVILYLVWRVKKELGEPIFFYQERPGKDGTIFKMYKFRTMLDLKDDAGNLLPDEQRLSLFGKKLRASGLDELPELWNVIKGDMSLVGPRPLLVEYLTHYSQSQMRRHEVSPGITGWAQVNGRNCISFKERFDFDVWYVDNHNLFLDIKILLLTVKQVWVKKIENPISDTFVGNPKLAILGAGGHAKVVYDIAKLNKRYDNIIFIANDSNGDMPISGNYDYLIQHLHEYEVIIAIGNNAQRETLGEKLLSLNAKIVTLIHPDACICEDAVIGLGSVVMPGVVINSSSNIGKFTIINSCAVIEHDCTVADYAHISPGSILTGAVSVGKSSWIGANSVVNPKVIIGKNVIVGAGSVVIKNIEDNITVIGVPAKDIRDRT